MRVFIAGLATESNTFAPFPTGLAGYAENGLRRDASIHGEGPLAGPLVVFRRRAEAAGDEVIESLSAFAQPSGRTLRRVYEGLRDEILGDLRAAGPVDIVLLGLHGAMVADGYDDCEGDLIGRARAIAPKAVIGVELDLHCHLTEAMVREADLVIPVKEYPHVDFDERAAELFDLCRRKALGEIAPVAALVDTRLIGFYPTFDAPMSGIVAELRRAEDQPGVLSASIAHGFPWADVADVGTRVLVYSGGDGALAAREAMAIARRLYAARQALALDIPDIPTALARAKSLEGRTVLGDFADNAGGGAPGDSTFFLRAMLDGGWRDAAIGCFWDPIAADTCAEAGVGARFPLRLGGKSGPASGLPLDLEVEVMNVVEAHSQGVFGRRQPMGRSVWVRTHGIDVAICSKRSQVFEPDAFTGLGIGLDDKRLVVVKSSNHFQAGFRPIADHILRVRSPGAMSIDFAQLPYTKRDGDYFPRVDDPWAVRGVPEPRVFGRAAI